MTVKVSTTTIIAIITGLIAAGFSIGMIFFGLVLGPLCIKSEVARTIAIKELPENPEEFSEIYAIDVSAYASLEKLTDSDPWITASGKLCKPGTIALSRDLLDQYTEGAPFSFGDKVMLIKIYGIFNVDDTMAKRYEMRGDIWKPTEKEANRFGIDRGVLMIRMEQE